MSNLTKVTYEEFCACVTKLKAKYGRDLASSEKKHPNGSYIKGLTLFGKFIGGFTKNPEDEMPSKCMVPKDLSKLPEPIVYVESYTTAPEDYDGFGTRTVETIGKGVRGKAWRLIETPAEHINWQKGRNGSGLHPTWSREEWEEQKEFYFPVS